MTFDTYLAYVLAAFVVLMIPGPSTILVLSYTLSEGRRAIPAIVGGVVAGDLVSITASLAGIEVLIDEFPPLFEVLKWFGVVYLLYLGYRCIRPAHADPSITIERAGIPKRTLFVRGFVITAINPEGLGFFINFLPEFMDLSRPHLPQMVILIATYVGLAVVGRLIYAFGAQGARGLLSSDRAQLWVHWGSGAVMIAIAVWSIFALEVGTSGS